MKNRIKNIFTLYMVFAVLASSHAYAYYEHLCLFTKITTVSLSPKDCSGEEPPVKSQKENDETTHFEKKSCCELSVGFKKVDDSQNHISFLGLSFFDLAFINNQNFNFQPELLVFSANDLHFGDSSPPFLSQKTYISNCTYLI